MYVLTLRSLILGCCLVFRHSCILLNSGYGHCVGTLQGLSIVPVAIGELQLAAPAIAEQCQAVRISLV